MYDNCCSNFASSIAMESDLPQHFWNSLEVAVVSLSIDSIRLLLDTLRHRENQSRVFFPLLRFLLRLSIRELGFSAWFCYQGLILPFLICSTEANFTFLKFIA